MTRRDPPLPSPPLPGGQTAAAKVLSLEEIPADVRAALNGQVWPPALTFLLSLSSFYFSATQLMLEVIQSWKMPHSKKTT